MYAYLMLLRIEVTAFHPAAPRPENRTRNTEVAVSVHAKACPRTSLVSVALFLGLQVVTPVCRTAVSRYPALWSPDPPRYT